MGNDRISSAVFGLGTAVFGMWYFLGLGVLYLNRYPNRKGSSTNTKHLNIARKAITLHGVSGGCNLTPRLTQRLWDQQAP